MAADYVDQVGLSPINPSQSDAWALAAASWQTSHVAMKNVTPDHKISQSR